MGIGRIASFLNSLSPASDAAVAASTAEPVFADPFQTGALAHEDHERHEPQAGLAEINHQLQTMITAVRSSNDNAVQQGAAVAVSPAGAQLTHAVTGLAHILAAIGTKELVGPVAAQVREAARVVDVVETGLADSQAAAHAILGQLPTQQAAAARQAAERFQSDMRAALSQVRDVLDTLMR